MAKIVVAAVNTPAGYVAEAVKRLMEAQSSEEFDLIRAETVCRANEFEEASREILDALPDNFESIKALRAETA
jgi:hypothetical protein